MFTLPASNNQRTETFKNKNVLGLLIAIELTHATAATAITGSPLDFSKSNVTVTLQRNGKNITIVSTSLEKALFASVLDTEGEKLFVGNQVDSSTVLRVQNTGIKEKRLFSTFLDFGGIINLQGGDVLSVTLRNNLVHSATYENTSTMLFDVIEGIGYEGGILKGTPLVEVVAIETNQAQPKLELGSHIQKISFLNFTSAQNSHLEDKQIINDLILESDKYSYKASALELRMRDALRQNYQSSVNETYQSRVFYRGMPINKVKLELNLDTTLLDGKQFLVIHKFAPSEEVQKRTLVMIDKHNKVNSANSY